MDLEKQFLEVNKGRRKGAGERESLTHTPSTNRAPSAEAPKSQEPSEPQGSQGFSHISACHIHSLRNELQLLFLEKQNPSSPGCTLGLGLICGLTAWVLGPACRMTAAAVAA